MKIEYIDGTLLKNMFIGATNFLEKNKEMLNALNVFPVPDGDTGTNMTLTMNSATRELLGKDTPTLLDVANTVSNGSLMGARGNSGVILSQILRGFSKALEGKDKLDTTILADALDKGSKTAYKAVMKPIEGTILTVSRECAEYAVEFSREESDITVFFRNIIQASKASLNNTPSLLPVLKEAGVVDAGGQGFVIMLEGMASALDGSSRVEEKLTETTQIPVKTLEKDLDKHIEFGYCTEFIIKDNKKDSEYLAHQIKDIGDSMVVVDGDGFIKVHVHTNSPGTVLETALEIGELVDIKIDNMRYQHEGRRTEDKKLKEYGFITVSMGDGLRDIFKDLNVDYIISGGQTMNPSTEDILDAVRKVDAKNIIILPNNSNIVLAANQASDISEKSVSVLPTKTIPQGITALLEFNEELDLEDNLEVMNEAIERIKTSQVTFSVRDTTLDGREIRKGDYLGISDGKLTSVGVDREEVTLDLIYNTLDDESELITIFYGEEVEEDEGRKIIDVLKEKYDDLDIELIYGGQPIYYYLIAVE